MEKPKQSKKYGPVTGGSDYPDDVDVKRVKLKVSRKQLEEMTKEEVFELIKSERKKYKQARKEKKKEIRRKKREQKKAEGKKVLPFDIHTGSVALSIIISVLILGGSILYLNLTSDEEPPADIGAIEARTFSLNSTPWEDHDITSGTLYAGIGGQWDDQNYDESITEIDDIIAEAGDDEDLVKEFEILKLHAIARSGDHNRAIHYSRTLQQRYSSDSDFMSEIYWYRGHLYYKMDRPYDAYRAFQSVGRNQGDRAEEAWGFVDYISDNYL